VILRRYGVKCIISIRQIAAQSKRYYIILYLEKQLLKCHNAQ